MISPEGGAFGAFSHEQRVRARGMIGTRDGFGFPMPEQDVMQQFNQRWESLGKQVYPCGDRLRRLDCYMENQNIIQSIVDIVHIDDDGIQDCIATSLIITSEEQAFIEVHPSKEKDGRILWEPAVGDELIQPGGYEAYLLFCHTAYASELLERA